MEIKMRSTRSVKIKNIVIIFFILSMIKPYPKILETSNIHKIKKNIIISNKKYQLWLRPSYFKGFNVNYWSYSDDYVKTLKDINDLKKTRANLVKINIYGGTINFRPPYKPIQENIDALDNMIKFCRKINIYYIIDVRAGPGRKDVAEDNIDKIWTDKKAQQKYAEMLKGYVKKYGKDSLFIGLNLMVEPNPLWREINNNKISTPNELKDELKKKKIDIHGMFKYFIKEVRTVNKYLPLIIQNINYSNPEWWDLMKKQDDPFIIYDVHSYVPYEYSHANRKNSKKYHDLYWCTTLEKDALFNKKLLKNVILSKVIKFQKKYKVPILLGEFGLQYQQKNGVEYLSDYVDIAKSQGWHFCLWNYRSDNPDNKKKIIFDPEKWDKSYWNEILSWFK
jgi:hypothetical protein